MTRSQKVPSFGHSANIMSRGSSPLFRELDVQDRDVVLDHYEGNRFVGRNNDIGARAAYIEEH